MQENQSKRKISKKRKPCKITFFGLNGAHMRAQDLKIGGFGTEFRDEAIGIGLRTQKHAKNMENKFKLFFASLSQARSIALLQSKIDSHLVSTGFTGQ